MANKSTPRAIIPDNLSEEDDTTRYVVEKRPSRAEWTEAGTSIAAVLEDIATSHPAPTSPVQPANPVWRTDAEASTGTDDASRTLLDLRRGTNRSETEDTRKKQKAKNVSELRPTSSFTAYYDYMHNLVQLMGRRHWEAYEDSVFRHYVHFGPPGLDLPTFEHVLRQWDEDKKKFVFTDANTGEDIECSFNLEWVKRHTWFSNEGDFVSSNRDRRNRIWSRFFTKPEGDSSNAPPPAPTRQYVERILTQLVHSTDREDVKDFVLLQILYQLSMIWCPSTVLGIPRHLFKYVDSIEQANNTAWGTYIFSETSDAIEKALKGPAAAGKKMIYLQGCTQLVCLWYYELTGIKKPVMGNLSRPPLCNWVRLGEVGGSIHMATVVAKARQATIKLPEFQGQVQSIEEPVRALRGKEQEEEKEKRKEGEKKKEREREKNKKPAARDTGRARHPGQPIPRNKKKGGSEDDIILQGWTVELDNEAVDQMELSEQVRYWKSIGILNKKLRRDIEKKYKDEKAADRLQISSLHVKVASLSAEVRRLREELSNAQCRSLSVYSNKRLSGEVSSTAMEQQACTGTPHDVSGIGIEIEREFPQPDFTDVDKEREADVDREMGGIRSGEVPLTGDFPPADTFTDVHKESVGPRSGEVPSTEDTEKECPRPDEAPPPLEAGFSSDDEAPLIIKMKKRKRDADLPAPLKKSRAKRRTKPSKHVITPYTEGKKKAAKEKQILGEKEIVVVGEKGKEMPPARLHGDPLSIWKTFIGSPMSEEEEKYRDELNTGIPFPHGFIIKFYDDHRTFFHNYKISAEVAPLLTEEENKVLNHFCICRCNNVIKAYRSQWASIDRIELLNILRGGRLDDSVTEALIETIREWQKLPQNKSHSKKYGLVSVFFSHTIHVTKGEPDYRAAYDNFIKSFIDEGITDLFVPIVQGDHWHLLEFDMKNDVAKHYDSLSDRSGHWEPVMNIVKAFNHIKAGFDANKLYSVFNPIRVPCEQQKGA